MQKHLKQWFGIKIYWQILKEGLKDNWKDLIFWTTLIILFPIAIYNTLQYCFHKSKGKL